MHHVLRKETADEETKHFNIYLFKQESDGTRSSGDGGWGDFTSLPVLEFYNTLWGLRTENEEGCRTGPLGNTGWLNRIL